MAQALQLKQMVGEGLAPYRNIFRAIKKQTSQAEIAVYFHKFTWSVPASRASASSETVRAASRPFILDPLTVKMTRTDPSDDPPPLHE